MMHEDINADSPSNGAPTRNAQATPHTAHPSPEAVHTASSPDLLPSDTSPEDNVPPLDSGLICLLMMAELHGLVADRAKLTHEYGEAPFDTTTLLHAAQSLGFTAKSVKQPPLRLHKAPLPCIALDNEGRFFILAKIDNGQPETEVAATGRPAGKPKKTGLFASTDDDTPDTQKARCLIQRPGEPPQVWRLQAFLATWGGELIFLTSKASFAGDMSRFDFTWFIPAIVKYRKLLGEVLLVSLVLQIVGLITPLFFQVVMDKVLTNHALLTLNVIAIGLFCATVFEALLTGIRAYVFAHTSSKIDVELGAQQTKLAADSAPAYALVLVN